MLDSLKIFTSRFCELSDNELEELSQIFKPTPIKRLDHLTTEGNNLNEIFFIAEGIFRGYHLKDGVEYTTNFYFSPSIITDLIAIRSKEPTVLNIQALKNADCYTADFNELESLINQHVNIQILFYKLIEHLFIVKTKRERSFIHNSPEERYIKLFSERPKVIAEMPLQYIASYIGIKPETLSRIRKKMR
ncbi:MAG: hypothetical protein BM557_04850 [Flavobacterium sp. MedPE-SWcel]|uniref:Crp/Fnr family transcriptional regulator n=1 Tax=uncultured Flavobacterium sp. TaxID=165435 RepID=UPI000917AB6C|nr:Crp/Fnr family transcriptional regulator [uncultured Flavobacterium sp.]OIQ21088.1 MAG: hypothetical protein BM557_04850 [Flavobacterium sp. MedPE-SWcel]